MFRGIKSIFFFFISIFDEVVRLRLFVYVRKIGRLVYMALFSEKATLNVIYRIIFP